MLRWNSSGFTKTRWLSIKPQFWHFFSEIQPGAAGEGKDEAVQPEERVWREKLDISNIRQLENYRAGRTTSNCVCCVSVCRPWSEPMWQHTEA